MGIIINRTNVSVGGGLAINGHIISGMAHNGNLIYKINNVKIVSFSEGTDEEIGSMLQAHYEGKINISNYWHVGDTRLVHIEATNSGYRNHVAQDMTMVIMDFGHDDLTTPINGKNKAAVTIGFREAIGSEGNNEREYYWGSSHIPVADTENYSASPLRTWLNGELLSALPSTFSSLIKEVNKKNLQYHSKADGAPLITKDKIWLFSYQEVFGTEIYMAYLSYANPSNYEGEQYEYMKTSANRIKKANNNGAPGSTVAYYWLRSPSSSSINPYGYYWCRVFTNGKIDYNDGSATCFLAPGFCL